MKKEYIYILIMSLIFASAYYYINIVIKDKVLETEKLVSSIEDLNARFYKDSITQNGINLIKTSFDYNRLRKGQKFDNIIVDNSLQIEGILKELKIEYNPNNIGSSKDEMKQGSFNFYEINLSFVADFKKVIEFINILENDLSFISILELDISKKNQNEESNLGSFNRNDLLDNVPDENITKILSVDMKIQFLKIM